jgi:peptidoglycan hydrolase-like protein with peptidoglycan-binding domain
MDRPITSHRALVPRASAAVVFALMVNLSYPVGLPTFGGASAPSVAAADLSWPYYAQGADHPNVRTIELLLSSRGYGGFDIDTYFGANTTTAVRQFQNAKGLTVTGAVGNQTWPVLVKEVRRGDSGRAVEALQRQLNQQGSNLATDGGFGEATGAELIYYKSSRCLAIDEVAGDPVWNSLVNNTGARPQCFGDLPRPSLTDIDPLLDDPDYGDAPCSEDPANPESNVAKPGAIGLGNILQNGISSINFVGISRDCSDETCDAVGFVSEHCEGRAIDVGFLASDLADRARVREMLRWLMIDAGGNETACDRARALGLMYIIWDGRTFNFEPDREGAGCKAGSGKNADELSAWWSSTWRDYSPCVAGSSASVCHTNHVHISLNWKGARKNTAWWQ